MGLGDLSCAVNEIMRYMQYMNTRSTFSSMLLKNNVLNSILLQLIAQRKVPLSVIDKLIDYRSSIY